MKRVDSHWLHESGDNYLDARRDGAGATLTYLISGPHALLAYETRAGVRFGSDVLGKGDLSQAVEVALVGSQGDQVAQAITTAADKVRCQITLSPKPTAIRYPVFREFVVGKNGRMVIMPAMDPRDFAGTPRHSQAVLQLLDERLPAEAISSL